MRRWCVVELTTTLLLFWKSRGVLAAAAAAGDHPHRRLQAPEVPVGEIISTGSEIVAGREAGSDITWENTNITALECVARNGPIQVSHEAPYDETNILHIFYSFETNATLAYFALDDYDPAINSVVQRLGQPTRVNAAGMLFDSDGSNYPLAAFLFGEEVAYLCRYDVLSIECFEDSPLQQIGGVPFVGFIFNATYFYSNGLGAADSGVSRPLFVVHDVNADKPDFNQKGFYVERTSNRDLRCADLTGFGKGTCYDSSGNAIDCVVETLLEGEVLSTPADQARAFLTCVADEALGIVLITLTANLDPQYYLWIEGVDLVVDDYVYPPGNDGTKTIPVSLDGRSLGTFGACYQLDPLSVDNTPVGTRVFCSANDGGGMWEIMLPVEVGYCIENWHQIGSESLEIQVDRCQRWCPAAEDDDDLCDEVENPQALGGKPKLARAADHQSTTRNDGLSCRTQTRAEEEEEEEGPAVDSSAHPSPLPTAVIIEEEPRSIIEEEVPLFEDVMSAPPSPVPKFGADPVVVGARGTKIQFWLPLGRWLPMLATPDGIEFYVRCFGKPGTHAQWIDGIVIKERGKVTLDAVVRRGDVQDSEHALSFLQVKLDGKPVEKIAAGYASNRGSAVVDLAKNDYPILDELGDAVSVATSAFQLEFFTMPARKYKDDYEAAKWTHIDFKFVSVKNRDKCTGFLSDLMFGTDTFDPELKASWLKKPPVLDTDDYDVEAPEVLAGLVDVVFS